MSLTTLTASQSRSGTCCGGLNVAVIRNAADLRSLLESRRRRRQNHVLLEIPGMPEAQCLRWEARLNACLRECGCSMGARCSAAALLASVVGQFLQHGWSLTQWPAFILRTVLLVFIAGGLGKLLGLALAEFQIRYIRSRLLSWIEVPYQGEQLHVNMH